MPTYSEKEILDNLDQCSFPDLGHPFFHNQKWYGHDVVGGRLIGFQDVHNWALIIQIVSSQPSQGCIILSIYGYGNCIHQEYERFCPTNTCSKVGQRICSNNLYDKNGYIQVDSLTVRGEKVNLNPLEWNLPDPSQNGVFPILINLWENYQDKLVAKDEELRLLIPELPKVIELNNWYNPYQMEKASDTESMRLIARVLTTGKSSLYKPVEAPHETPNISWQNRWHYSDSMWQKV